jgi:hypothetical protein
MSRAGAAGAGDFQLDLAAAFRTGFKFGFGSGAGIRTLNLAVNRSVKPVQK